MAKNFFNVRSTPHRLIDLAIKRKLIIIFHFFLQTFMQNFIEGNSSHKTRMVCADVWKNLIYRNFVTQLCAAQRPHTDISTNVCISVIM